MSGIDIWDSGLPEPQKYIIEFKDGITGGWYCAGWCSDFEVDGSFVDDLLARMRRVAPVTRLRLLKAGFQATDQPDSLW